jgi:predicted phosphodiesterase
MVKLHIVSDLHYEFFPLGFEDYLPKVEADCIIIAGDYHRSRRAVRHMRQPHQFPHIPIIYVAGNHEHYKTGLPVSSDLTNLHKDAQRDRNISGKQTYFLENETIETSFSGQKIRFIGATLWTDFALFGDFWKYSNYAKLAMNDFIYIRSDLPGEDELQPDETIRWHNASRNFIEGALRKTFNGRTIVITHHLPSIKSVSAQYKSDPLTPAFTSDCEDLLSMGADLWVHGHTHTSSDYIFGTTRVVCNPRGYGLGFQTENKNFRPDLVITL